MLVKDSRGNELLEVIRVKEEEAMKTYTPVNHALLVVKIGEEYLLGFYEETYFPQKIEKAGKYSYVERNYEMIDESAYCVFYYDKNYLPPTKTNSGTKIAYEYALRKKKTVINLFK